MSKSRFLSVLIVSSAEGFNTAINFLFLPYLARVLSLNDYGTYGQTILVIDIFSAFSVLGLQSIIYVYLAKPELNKTSVFKSNLYSGIFFGFLGSLCIYLSSGLISTTFDNPFLTPMLKLYSVSVMLQITYNLINSTLIFHNKIKHSMGIISGCNLLRVVLMFIAIQYYSSIKLTFIAILSAQAVQLLLVIWNLPNELKVKGEFRFKLALEQVKYGFPLALTAIGAYAYKFTDAAMVSAFLGVKEYAIYRAGAFEVPFVATIYSSVAVIVLPEISKLFGEGDISRIIQLKRKVIQVTAVVIYPMLIFLVFFHKPLILLYLSSKYSASAAVFMVFNLSLLMRINDYHDVFVVSAQTGILLKAYLGMFLMNLVLNVFMIRWYGYIGASIATIFSLLLFALYLFFHQARVLGCRMSELFDFTKIFKGTMVSLLTITPLWLISMAYSFNRFHLLMSMAFYFFIVYFVLLKMDILDKEYARILADRIPFMKPVNQEK